MSHIAKANGVRSAMDQIKFIWGTIAAPVDLEDEGEGDGESVWTQSLDTIVSTFANSKN